MGFSVKLANKSWIMALTPIICVFFLRGKNRNKQRQRGLSPCYIYNVSFSFGHPQQPANQASHPALIVSCHLPIKAGSITQMNLAKGPDGTGHQAITNLFGSTTYVSSVSTSSAKSVLM